MNISNSVFQAFLNCPACALAMYEGKVRGDPTIKPTWVDAGSQAMACGSLLDAMVTKQFACDADDKAVNLDDLTKALKSSYDDGSKSAAWLLTAKGQWNSYAKVTINAGNRLLADPVTQTILANAKFQTRVQFTINGWTWTGDIDILNVIDGTLYIIDLKHVGPSKDGGELTGWITQYGKNVKVDLWTARAYWFQLAAYRYGLAEGSVIVDGNPVNVSDFMPEFKDVRQGILCATREEFSQRAYIPQANMVETFLMAVAWPKVGGGASWLDRIAQIVNREAEAPGCGTCDYCKSLSRVTLPVFASEDEIVTPPIDDKYGMNL